MEPGQRKPYVNLFTKPNLGGKRKEQSNDSNWVSYDPNVQLSESCLEDLFIFDKKRLHLRRILRDIHDISKQSVLVSSSLIRPETMHSIGVHCQRAKFLNQVLFGLQELFGFNVATVVIL
jgi:hypothetical protein